jgi:hypothetical protein
MNSVQTFDEPLAERSLVIECMCDRLGGKGKGVG